MLHTWLIILLTCLGTCKMQHVLDAYSTNFCNVQCGPRINICCLYEGYDFGTNCRNNLNIHDIAHWDAEYILDVTNTLRDKVASGQAERIDLRGITASNMHVLSYSKQLAYTAGCWAKQCVLGHSRCKAIDEGPIGETVCYLKTFNRMINKQSFGFIKECVQRYLSFFPNFTTNLIDRFHWPRYGNDERNSETIQIIWARARYIGCSRVSFPHLERGYSIFLLVCHYFPTIYSKRHESVFIRGKPCSGCLQTEVCNKRYPNLCGEIRTHEEDTWIAPIIVRKNSGGTVLLPLSLLLRLMLYVLIKL